jgi:hypothetical protein
MTAFERILTTDQKVSDVVFLDDDGKNHFCVVYQFFGNNLIATPYGQPASGNAVSMVFSKEELLSLVRQATYYLEKESDE